MWVAWVSKEELFPRWRHGNEARWGAMYRARRVTDESVPAIDEHFGGVSTAAISRTFASVENRLERILPGTGVWPSFRNTSRGAEMLRGS